MIEARRGLITGLETSIRGRVLNAQPIELLSERDHKRVELVEDINGSKFVRRVYTQPAIDGFEKIGVPFTEAWSELHHIFGAVGIEVVPTTIFQPSEEESPFPLVVATQYLEGDINSASRDAKVRMATSLGAIPGDTSKFLPGAEVFMPDMFRVKRDDSGIDSLVLVDVDPYIVDRWAISVSSNARDIWNSAYVRTISRHMWDSWCQPSERRAVIGAFVRSLSEQDEFRRMDDSRACQAMLAAHSMSQGLDLRNFEL